MTGWTVGEKSTVAAAAALAPSMHSGRSWVLELRDGYRASLYERLDRSLPHHDPLGRVRLISCGAALEHVLLAVRVLGWTAEVDLRPDRHHPDEVGRVTATGRAEPSDVDLRRYDAISARHSHRRPFSPQPVDTDLRRELLGAPEVDGVEVRLVRGDTETTSLAGVLNHAALVLRADHAYQRELSAWTAPVHGLRPGAGLSTTPRRTATRKVRAQTRPWAGLPQPSAMLDMPALAHRLRDELLLLVETPGEGPLDHIRAGMAAEQIWLAAVAAGLVGSLLIQPFQLREARDGLEEALSLNGFPQLLLRFGRP